MNEKLRRGKMREAALAFREALQPDKFDGTERTYHANLQKGLAHLIRAKFWRDFSHTAAFN